MPSGVQACPIHLDAVSLVHVRRLFLCVCTTHFNMLLSVCDICGSSYPWSSFYLSAVLSQLIWFARVLHYPTDIIIILPLLRFWILIHSDLHNLVKLFMPPPFLWKYKWHSGLLSGKMLWWYSMRLLSWITCHPIDVCGRRCCLPVVTLVGTNKHFWRCCRGRHRLNNLFKYGFSLWLVPVVW